MKFAAFAVSASGGARTYTYASQAFLLVVRQDVAGAMGMYHFDAVGRKAVFSENTTVSIECVDKKITLTNNSSGAHYCMLFFK